MKFTPLKFQGTLAAAGIALMAYVYLQTSIFKTEEAIDLSRLSLLPEGSLEQVTALLLTVLMGLFIAVHLIFTAVFLKELFGWLVKTDGFKVLMKNPLANSALFSPLISLPMTLMVLFGPASFFVPQLTENIQSLALPAFIVFSLLWAILILLEIKVALVVLTESFEHEKLSFGWLLDVLALGAVSLLGSSIANLPNIGLIATAAAFMAMVTLLIGIAVFAAKVATLLYKLVKSASMPGTDVLPAYFLVIPPICLLWLSFYKLLTYSGNVYGLDTSVISFVVIVSSYLAAIGWFAIATALLKDYLTKRFLSCDFSHAQWGMV